MDGNPLVSVVMPVYGCEKYLKRSIDSVLTQEYRNLELIVINDDASEAVSNILGDYLKADHRVKIVSGEGKGVIAARNLGSRMARGKYVAVQDCDDLSSPSRLEKQVAFLETRPDIGLLCTWARFVGEADRTLMINRSYVDPYVAGWQTFLGNAFVHSSMMVRRDLMEQLRFYDDECRFGEDYDLVAKAADISKIASLPEVLVVYRVRQDSQSGQSRMQQEAMAVKIMEPRIAALLGEQITTGRISDLRRLMAGSCIETLEQIDSAYSLLMRMQDAYIKQRVPPGHSTKMIRRSTGSKIYLFGLSAVKISPWKGLSYFARAFIQNPLLPARRIMIKAEPFFSGEAKKTMRGNAYNALSAMRPAAYNTCLCRCMNKAKE